MSIVEFDGPPSWFLNASETGESTKCLWVVAVGLKCGGEGAEKIDCNSFTLSRVRCVSCSSNGNT